MGFQQGLSGLNASSRNLDVIGHNIANANTVGMKSGRAEFADLVASSLGYGGAQASGIGVNVATVSQQFTQGNITITGNDLDLAINGAGFFGVQMSDGAPAYTRAGNLKLDADGFIVTNTGAKVLGYTIATQLGDAPTPIQLPTNGTSPARQTTGITAEFNLPADPATNATHTTYGTTITVFDSQGRAIPTTFYMYPAKDAATGNTISDQWDIYTDPTSYESASFTTSTAAPVNSTGPAATTTTSSTDPTTGAVTTVTTVIAATADTITYPDGFTSTATTTVSTPAQNIFAKINFDYTGQNPVITAYVNGVAQPAGTSPTISVTTPNNNIPTGGVFPVTLDLSGATQFANQFSVTNLSQDGYTSGDLTGIKIDDNGVITARFSNGETQEAGRFALFNFRNVQGLAQVGNGMWVETNESGQPTKSAPGEGKMGTLTGGALEDSNVDLTAELVNMMTAQRAYQANAQTIKTQDQVLSTLVNLR